VERLFPHQRAASGPRGVPSALASIGHGTGGRRREMCTRGRSGVKFTLTAAPLLRHQGPNAERTLNQSRGSTTHDLRNST